MDRCLQAQSPRRELQYCTDLAETESWTASNHSRFLGGSFPRKNGVLELSSAPLPHAQAALHEQAGRAHLPAILFYGGYQVAYQNSLLLYLQDCLLDLSRLVAEQQVFAQGFHSQNCLLPCKAQLAGFCQTWSRTSSHFWAEICCPAGLCKARLPRGSASPNKHFVLWIRSDKAPSLQTEI